MNKLNTFINATCDPAMPAGEYHSRDGTWAHSQLKKLPDDPEAFYWLYIAKQRPAWVEQPAFGRNVELGTAFHAMLLEGVSQPVVPPEILASNGAMTTTAARAFKAAHPNYLKQDEFNALNYAVSRCHEDPEIHGYLETDGLIEASWFAMDSVTGLPVRGRSDKLCRFSDGLELLDVKFSNNTDQRWFDGQLANMSYYRQAAFYVDLVEAATGESVNAFTFLVVRNGFPYDSVLYRMNTNDIDLGRRHNRAALDDLKRRMDSGEWKRDGFGRVNYTHLPKWKWNDDDKGPVQPYQEFSEFNQQ